jgi:hypothetical protein
VLPALGERQRPQISAVQPDHVEGHIDGFPRVAEKVIELRSTSFVGCDDLAVSRHSHRVRLQSGRWGRRSGSSCCRCAAERAEAVVFEVEEPLGIAEWLRPANRGDGLDARQH